MYGNVVLTAVIKNIRFIKNTRATILRAEIISSVIWLKKKKHSKRKMNSISSVISFSMCSNFVYHYCKLFSM